MTIFSSFSANFPPHYNTILAITCVHASNWFTHLQQTRQIHGQNHNSVLTVYIYGSQSIASDFWLFIYAFAKPADFGFSQQKVLSLRLAEHQVA